MSEITLGILGGGQLGSMLSVAAKKLNVKTIIYSDDQNAPAHNFCDKFINAKYNDKDNVPRPDHWSGWNLSPTSIEFWLDGDSRIHERLKYIKNEKGNWDQSLLSP